jgi:hypothetical protein
MSNIIFVRHCFRNWMANYRTFDQVLGRELQRLARVPTGLAPAIATNVDTSSAHVVTVIIANCTR